MKTHIPGEPPHLTAAFRARLNPHSRPSPTTTPQTPGPGARCFATGIGHLILLTFACLLMAGCASGKSRAERRVEAKAARVEQLEDALARNPGDARKKRQLEAEQTALVVAIAELVTEKLREGAHAEAEEDRETRAQTKVAKNRPGTRVIEAQDEPMTATGRGRFFVLEPGYQLVLAGREGGQAVELVITALDETKLVGGARTRVVEERRTVDGSLTAITRSYLAHGTRHHHLYCLGEEVEVHQAGRASQKSAWLAGEVSARKTLLMPAELKPQTCYYPLAIPGARPRRVEVVSLEETVKTPAGTFEHCAKTRETPPGVSGHAVRYYAPGIGLVRVGDLVLVRHGVTRP